MIYLSIFFLVIALVLFFLGSRQRQKTGLPAGRVIYSDTGSWEKIEKPLYHPELRLAGKPDYLVRQGRQIIPVEMKTGRTPHSPRDSHIYQLAAYALLVEHEYGISPRYGIIRYPEKTFAIDFNRTLNSSIRNTIREMQAQSSRFEVNRSHQDAKRCLHCGYRTICDQALRI